MKNYFDYMYYRFTQAYFKWDGRTGATGIFAIVMIQILFIINLHACFNLFFLTRSQTQDYVSVLKLIYSLIFIFLCVVNFKKYDGRYNELRSKWKDETKSKRILKGIFIIFSLVFSWMPVILIGIFWDRK